MASFVDLIHGIDSLKTLKEINKQAKKNDRIINCLLQVKIAQEETKFGLEETELQEIFDSNEFQELKNVNVTGLMGMASFTSNETQVEEEFGSLKTIFEKFRIQNSGLKTLSMGMSGDYKTAIDQGSTMIRVGSAIFGSRQ
jgi:pyridoxal phosphate enzyme (YggS family)